MQFNEKRTEHYYEVKFKGERFLYGYPERKTVEFFAYPDNIVFTEQDLRELLAFVCVNDDKTSSSTTQSR